jgi:hypothetical protein
MSEDLSETAPGLCVFYQPCQQHAGPDRTWKNFNVSSRNNWQAAKSRDFCGLLNLSRKFSFFGRLFERFILVKSSSTCHVTMVFLMQEFCQIIMFFKLQIALHDVP